MNNPEPMWEKMMQSCEMGDVGAILSAGYLNGQISRTPETGLGFDMLRLL